MNRTLIVLTVSLSSLACSKNDVNKRPDTESASGAGVPAAVVPAVLAASAVAARGAAPAAKQLDCAKLVPAELQKRLGLTNPETSGSAPNITGAKCDFEGGRVGVNVMCPTWSEDTFRKTMEVGRASAMKHKGFRDLPGTGRMGYVSSPGVKMSIAQVWDDDTMCYATVAAKDAATAETLSKEFVKNLSPSLLGN